MRYNEFLENVARDLKEAMGSNFETEIVNVPKLQGESYRGIMVRETGSEMGINFTVKPLHQQFEAGRPYDSIIMQLADEIGHQMRNKPNVDLEALGNYEAMKSSLSIQLVSKMNNMELLAKVPHQDVMDMAAVYRFDLGNHDGDSMSVLVTNKMLESYGISPRQLQADALENAPVSHPLFINSLYPVLSGMMEMPEPEPAPGENELIIASTMSKQNGAGVILYPDFMDKAQERVGGSFYILPSSVHEVLLLKDDGKMDYRDLKEMVTTINETQVDPADRLTDNVYHYDAVDRVLETGERYAQRQAEKAHGKISVLKNLDDKKQACHDHPQPSIPGRNDRGGIGR